MTNAQTWLDENIPLNQRNNIRELLIDNISQQERNERDNELGLRSRTANEYYLTTPLTGELNLSTFPHLKRLKVEHQSLTRLVLADCHSLESLEANDNLLREVVFPTQTQALESVYLTNNDLSARNLYCFSHFPNLRVLFLGTDDKDRIRQGIYNRWNGSLMYLLTLTKLEELDINATDIDDGLRCLATKGLNYFTFGSQGRTEAGVNQIKNIFKNDFRLKEGEDAEEWIEEWAADDDFDNNSYKIRHIRGWQERQITAWVVEVP
ncbi:protein of unknown function (RNI-like domain) [endosymbiont DhMRE of Dentiscutata heterogama]|uniref:hypothetical protein n=1 Tax=endosymbiont DhMRE of Dentiscutata heterogama TaxID=1609546 RepID=UPI000629D75D|nr:hypothetical protein [endosymbiont DhMRE of Dentiscutata heterogama]CFW93248.1 protein of unknown function (RNI-like domain) [endosymbiont DhMRE of Dentiscutata heterogama]